MIPADQITRLDRFLITVAVMSATLMQVLDTTIVNVALPHIQGSLGATPDQITWTLTSYLVSAAIFMPLTGYFSDNFGQKKFLLVSIFGFTIASILCGIAETLPELVIFRILQGIFGAGLVPLSQAILTNTYPANERGKAMAIWGVGVMVGPILGPTLGGYLTEIASWRWTFYVNVPVGILSLFLAMNFIKETPKKIREIDWISLILLSLAIGATQLFLDRGNQSDWFNATSIKISFALAVIGLVGFVFYSLTSRSEGVFDLTIFKDRNFTICSLLLGIFGIGLFGGMVILPLLLENLLNYPVLTTGLVMAPRGISIMISMILVGKFGHYFDQRLLIFIGTLCAIAGTYAGTFYSINVDTWWIIWPILLQGFGLGMIFVPLSTVGFATLKPELRADAAGLFSLTRTIGSSVGISLTITIFTRHAQMAWNQLGGFIQPNNPAVAAYLSNLHLSIQNPLSIAILANELGRQSQMIAFLDVYAFIMWSFILILPFIFFIKRGEIGSKQENVVGLE